jgi:hypothetical protein
LALILKKGTANRGKFTPAPKSNAGTLLKVIGFDAELPVQAIRRPVIISFFLMKTPRPACV